MGSDMGCNCLGIYSQYITGDNSLIEGVQCTRNQTRYGCLPVKPIWPARMGQFNGVRICGSATGVAFVNATRPTKVN